MRRVASDTSTACSPANHLFPEVALSLFVFDLFGFSCCFNFIQSIPVRKKKITGKTRVVHSFIINRNQKLASFVTKTM